MQGHCIEVRGMKYETRIMAAIDGLLSMKVMWVMYIEIHLPTKKKTI